MLLIVLFPLSAFSEQPVVIIEADVLNVRSEPWGTRVGRVYYGQQFKVMEHKDEWGLITFEPGKNGWISLDYAVPYKASSPSVSIQDYCSELNREFDNISWKDIRCRPDEWKSGGASVKGRPLLYREYNGKGPSTTLLFCSVHSDESTSYHCFRLNNLLHEKPELLKNRLIIVPLLNPDGFLLDHKTRINANGIDLNRNLPSSDWQRLAIHAWVNQYNSDPRRNPGPAPNSEPENRFLIDLIIKYQPDKIISIHSPLNFLDLDFLEQPSDDQNLKQVSRKAVSLATEISENSKFHYRNYNTFPGSLGRYGDELRIPIFTLELPDENPALAESYYERLEDSMVHSFNVILDELKNGGGNGKEKLKKTNKNLSLAEPAENAEKN